MSEKRGFGDFVDRLTSVAAIITAVAAVSIAVYEARINREQQKKSVWPYVMQYNSHVSGEEYSRSVENAGLGPALVRSFAIHMGDSVYHAWRPVVRALTGSDSVRIIYSSLEGVPVLRPGERRKVLRIPTGADAETFFEHRSKFYTTVCYCSVYGDCWIADSRKSRPSAVGSCGTRSGEE